MAASPISVHMDDREVRLGLGELGAAITDKGPLLRIVGELMRGSIARTFREEGSPAGSWPRLALSTLKKKGYTSGHKLLILSGRLFNSITYTPSDDTLTVGTNVVYAAVQNFGSADRRGGSVGAQAKIPGRGSAVGSFDYLRSSFKRTGSHTLTDKRGRTRTIRKRHEGPANQTKVHVGAHERHGNIPARPFLVFRPEDPQRFVSGIEAYLAGKSVRIGKIGGAPSAVTP